MSWANCSRCGKAFTFIPGGRDICPACVKEEEENYREVFRFFSLKPSATAQEIADETGVDLKEIHRFVRENRLRLVKAEAGLTCESCGSPLSHGKICGKCGKKLSDELKQDIDKIRRNKLNNSSNPPKTSRPKHLEDYRDKNKRK